MADPGDVLPRVRPGSRVPSLPGSHWLWRGWFRRGVGTFAGVGRGRETAPGYSGPKAATPLPGHRTPWAFRSPEPVPVSEARIRLQAAPAPLSRAPPPPPLLPHTLPARGGCGQFGQWRWLLPPPDTWACSGEKDRPWPGPAPQRDRDGGQAGWAEAGACRVCRLHTCPDVGCLGRRRADSCGLTPGPGLSTGDHSAWQTAEWMREGWGTLRRYLHAAGVAGWFQNEMTSAEGLGASENSAIPGMTRRSPACREQLFHVSPSVSHVSTKTAKSTAMKIGSTESSGSPAR